MAIRLLVAQRHMAAQDPKVIMPHACMHANYIDCKARRHEKMLWQGLRAPDLSLQCGQET